MTTAEQQQAATGKPEDQQTTQGAAAETDKNKGGEQQPTADDLWKQAGEQRASTEADELDDGGDRAAEEDPFAGLPEPTRKLFEQIQAKTAEQDKALTEVNQKLAKAHGTIGDLSKRLKDNLSELAKVKPTIAAVEEANRAEQEEQARQAADKKAQLKEQMKEFPVIAEYLETVLPDVKPVEKPVPKAKPDDEETPETREARLIAERELSDRHPKWIDTVRTTEFKTWKDSQPDDVKALAASAAIEDADTLLTMYEKHQKNAAEVARIAKENEERLRRNESIEGKGGASKEVDTSADAAWNKVKRDREKARANA